MLSQSETSSSQDRTTAFEAMSGCLGMNKGRLTSLIRLSYLGPEIVRALLAGSQSNAFVGPVVLAVAWDVANAWLHDSKAAAT
jgi:hypothetical protein